ncbi:unnamed protein product [Symbiodinium necroappetens]|uniref:Uncharacterized protein n=1 Tax=Symbiodinium necroappetens TaxID=1628268 RepID=A0A812SQM5_9DINO|nr:unnamed protein product [Symbiodinium necroappetens]
MAVAACLARFREDYDRRARGVAQAADQKRPRFKGYENGTSRGAARVRRSGASPRSNTRQYLRGTLGASSLQSCHVSGTLDARFEGVKSDANPSHESGQSSQIAFKSRAWIPDLSPI